MCLQKREQKIIKSFVGCVRNVRVASHKGLEWPASKYPTRLHKKKHFFVFFGTFAHFFFGLVVFLLEELAWDEYLVVNLDRISGWAPFCLYIRILIILRRTCAKILWIREIRSSYNILCSIIAFLEVIYGIPMQFM